MTEGLDRGNRQPPSASYSGTRRLYSVSPWADLSGAPICALEHLTALQPGFDEVCLVLCRHGPLEDRAREAGIPVWCVPFAFKGLRRAGLRAILRGIGPVVRSRWAYLRELRDLLRRKPGILHIHSRAAHLPYALLAGRWARVPVVVTIHEPWRGGWEAWSEVGLIRWLADRVVMLSHAMKRQYPRLLRNAAVVYNHGREGEPREAREPVTPRVLMVGHMVKDKGTDVFLDVCRRLRERGVEFEAWMVGRWVRAGEREEAERFLDRHGLRPTVSIRGVQERMEEIYLDTDILLLPTRRDSFPRVVMEAMFRGIPVVATHVDGIPEMVADGESGLLVEPEDAKGFADAVESLLRDPAARRRMGQAGRARALNLFSRQAYVSAFAEVYRGFTAGPQERKVP